METDTNNIKDKYMTLCNMKHKITKIINDNTDTLGDIIKSKLDAKLVKFISIDGLVIGFKANKKMRVKDIEFKKEYFSDLLAVSLEDIEDNDLNYDELLEVFDISLDVYENDKIISVVIEDE